MKKGKHSDDQLDADRDVPEDSAVNGKERKNQRPTKPTKPDKADSVESAAYCVALGYRMKGLYILPHMPFSQCLLLTNMPRDTLPTIKELNGYWTRWPQADPLCVMGRMSNLIAVQVGSIEAHMRLRAFLNGDPTAPTFSLYGVNRHALTWLFKHPDQPTWANMVTDHPDINLVGQYGALVLPPGRHWEGYYFRWADGRSLDDVEPPELPAVFLKMVKPEGTPAGGRTVTEEMMHSYVEDKLDRMESGLLNFVSETVQDMRRSFLEELYDLLTAKPK